MFFSCRYAAVKHEDHQIPSIGALVVAIPCVILYSFFRNRIDAIAADAGAKLDSLTMLLESVRAPVPEPGAGGSQDSRRGGASS